jgi:hypothetical protein
MKRFFLVIACFAAMLLSAQHSLGQTASGPHRVAVFLPLYLDSAFDASGQYRYGKQFPKMFNPGLEFYEGVQLGLDSLQKQNVKLEVFVYDTRGRVSIDAATHSPEFNEVDLILGEVSNNEIRPLAEVAQQKKIPFINVNFPNDGGVSNNNSLVILNSTLKTHCEAIYRFMQKNYATGKIVVFRKKGLTEDRLKGYLDDYAKNTAGVPLKLKYVDIPDNFNSAQLISHLDSTTTTLCLAASLDDYFARSLCSQLATLHALYPVQVMGMPTWDNLNAEDKAYKGLEILYSTPFSIPKNDKTATGITNYFKTALYSRPSDMVFRGYECIYHFGRLLQEYGANLTSSIGEKKYKVFTDFDIQPVLNKKTMALDYFENRKIYFVKKQDGVVKAVY